MRFYDQYLRCITATVTDPRFAIEDSTGHWRSQATWPVTSTAYEARLTSGQYVDDGGVSTTGSSAAPSATAASRGHWDTEHAPKLEPLTGAEKNSANKGDAATDSYWTWSRPAPRTLRMTATPDITFTASTSGNTMVRPWDVAPDGTATMFDENVALLEGSGPISFDLKSTDWTFQKGHRLGVQIGTITSRGWRDVPSGHTIRVSNARLGLDISDPRTDTPTQGDPSPFLDEYRSANTTTLTNVGPASFPLRVSQGR